MEELDSQVSPGDFQDVKVKVEAMEFEDSQVYSTNEVIKKPQPEIIEQCDANILALKAVKSESPVYSKEFIDFEGKVEPLEFDNSDDIQKFFCAGSEANQPVEVGEPSQDESPSPISTNDKTLNIIVSVTPNTIDEGISVNLPDKPFHPENVDLFPLQKLKDRTLKFQKSWYQSYPWLHYDTRLDGVICHTCSMATQKRLLDLARNSDNSFINMGFKNWKKAQERFRKHSKSFTHVLATQNLLQSNSSQTVVVQVSKQKSVEQENVQKVLEKLITSARYLAANGLAIPGMEADSGNYYSLIQLRSEDTQVLSEWLKSSSKLKYMSPKIPNEMLDILSYETLKQICAEINEDVYFSIIMDGTQDNQGKEQESICIRHVDKDFNIKEDFMGLYEVPATTDEILSKVLLDCLTRLQLPIENLRAQAYDGAANMSVAFKGCQARIKSVQPLALFHHCGPHITHLVISNAIVQAVFMRDALNDVQELGTLYGISGNLKKLYLNLDDDPHSNITSLKPICPTRWLTRAPAVERVLENYQTVRSSLKEAAYNFGTVTAANANGLYTNFSDGKCMLGLLASLPILNCIEKLNKCLQGTSVTVSGMLQAVEMTKENIQFMRSEANFKKIFTEALAKIDQYDLEEIPELINRKMPKRFASGSEEKLPDSLEARFRHDFYKVLDTAVTHLNEYFKSDDLSQYMQLCNMLLKGEYNDELVKKYPELNPKLQSELIFFRTKFDSCNNLEEYRVVFSNMVPEVRTLFPEVEKLLRLLLLSPASSCAAERSFSAIKRIKTWLRNTMTQQVRLNNVMLCHVHKDKVETLDPAKIAKKIVERDSTWSNTFGYLPEI